MKKMKDRWLRHVICKSLKVLEKSYILYLQFILPFFMSDLVFKCKTFYVNIFHVCQAHLRQFYSLNQI